MTVEIALYVIVVALVVLVGSLVTLLMQLRKPVAEAGDLLAHMNTELPVLLKEIRVITETSTYSSNMRGTGSSMRRCCCMRRAPWVTPYNGSKRQSEGRNARCSPPCPAQWQGSGP
jgi:hypothetical protein